MGEGGSSQQTSVCERPTLEPSVGVLRLKTNDAESANALATQQKSSPQEYVSQSTPVKDITEDLARRDGPELSAMQSDDRQTQVLAPPRRDGNQGQRWADKTPDAAEDSSLGEMGHPVSEVHKEISVSARMLDALPSETELTAPTQELQKHGSPERTSAQGGHVKNVDEALKSATSSKTDLALAEKGVTSESSSLNGGALTVQVPIFFL